MADDLIDYGRTRIKAKEFIGEISVSVASGDVAVTAGTNSLPAGTLQEVLQDIYDILATKADS